MNAAAESASNQVPVAAGNLDDAEYRAVLHRFNDSFAATMKACGGVLFTTDAADLWEWYLQSFPEATRQHYNCYTCRHFIERFGGLAILLPDGSIISAFWEDVHNESVYHDAYHQMRRAVRRAKITGVFLSGEAVLGIPATGVWNHLSVKMPFHARSYGLKTPSQAMAEKLEDFKNVSRALGEYPQDLVLSAVALLRSGTLPRPEKVLPQAEWLHALHVARAAAPSPTRNNVTWLHVATAPAGFVHIRSGMLGTLMDDINAGRSFDEIKSAYTAKVDPTKYQRPVAAPTAGNIAAAEKAMADLGVAASLRRRYARVDEIQAIWRPQPPKLATGPTGGIFGHLKPKDDRAVTPVETPPVVMTFAKFAAGPLLTAVKIELLTPPIGNFFGFITAVDPDAPPILQWDRADQRNPFSAYVYGKPTQSGQWGLQTGQWVEVTAIALKPFDWYGDGPKNHASGVGFVLNGAKDKVNKSSALFPEILKSEFHAFRSTIEAFSNSRPLEGEDEASAAGIRMEPGFRADLDLRVTSVDGIQSRYRLDRID